MGDVHPQGNPHYWLDPDNGTAIAQAMQDKLSELRSDRRGVFRRSASPILDKRLDEAEKRWLTRRMAPFKGTKIVTYHRSWPNFADRFGLERHRLRRAAGPASVAEPYAPS